MKQLSHYDIKNQHKQFPITIVCDAIRTPENIGMCFRVSESFGVSKIYLHENSPAVTNSIVKRTVYNTTPVTVEYELTPSGKEFRSVLDVMVEWGMQHRKRVLKIIG